MNIKKKKIGSLSFFLGYLFPGLGHIYLGRYFQGIVIMLSVISLFLCGIALGGGLIWVDTGFLNLLGFIVKFFNGIPFLIALALRNAPVSSSTYYEAGTSMILIAGALNVLVIISLFDVLQSGKEKREQIREKE